jgi:hypothetical protein
MQRISTFLIRLREIGLPAEGPLLPPDTFKLYEAMYAMYEEVLTNEDGDEPEIRVVLTLLPGMENFADTLDAFQEQCGGELLVATQLLATKLRLGLTAVRLRYSITDEDIKDWHAYFTTDEPH